MEAKATPAFLTTLFSSYSSDPPPDRPHVTLTFAQSIDAKIGSVAGGQLILSGQESMVMTHWMRTMHDGILIGIGTALNDNPQLNVRLLPSPPQPNAPPLYNLPRPIILDANLRLSITCKLLKNFQAGTGRRPWVFCASLTDARISKEQIQVLNERKHVLQTAGARIFEVDQCCQNGDRLSISSLLATLRSNGIKSLMVEGGARVIGSFLSEPIVDKIVITIAPVLIGDAGVGYRLPNADFRQAFKEVHTETFGNDTVIALTSLS